MWRSWGSKRGTAKYIEPHKAVIIFSTSPTPFPPTPSPCFPSLQYSPCFSPSWPAPSRPRPRPSGAPPASRRPRPAPTSRRTRDPTARACRQRRTTSSTSRASATWARPGRSTGIGAQTRSWRRVQVASSSLRLRLATTNHPHARCSILLPASFLCLEACLL